MKLLHSWVNEVTYESNRAVNMKKMLVNGRDGAERESRFGVATPGDVECITTEQPLRHDYNQSL